MYDMLQMKSALFVLVAKAAGHMAGLEGWPEGKNFPERSAAIMEKVHAHCVELGLPTSSISAKRLVDACRDNCDLATVKPIWDEFHGRLTDELDARLCLVIETNRVEFYSEPNLFGVDVASRWPETALDIEEAGKCVALDRGTACVFHLMRVLEIGLQSLETKLGTGIAKDRNWQPILNDINAAVARLPRSTPTEKHYLAQCSATAAHLQHVKDAWRNGVMHPRDSYTVEQALEIGQHVRSLMRKLAEFV